jgi:hypothetical protein
MNGNGDGKNLKLKKFGISILGAVINVIIRKMILLILLKIIIAYFFKNY